MSGAIDDMVGEAAASDIVTPHAAMMAVGRRHGIGTGRQGSVKSFSHI
jgi:hypothetical protein